MRKIATVLFIIISMTVLAQTERDSLWAVHNSANSSDEGRLEALWSLFDNQWVVFHPDTVRKYGDEMLALARQVGNDQREAEAIMNIGMSFVIKGAYQEADSCYRAAQEMADPDNEQLLAKIYMNRGLVQADTGNSLQAKDLYTKALDIARRTNMKGTIIGVLTNSGNLNVMTGDLASAVKMYTEALEIAEQLPDSASIGNNLSNIGRCHAMLGEIELGREYYLRAVDVFKRIHMMQNLPRALMNVAGTYMDTDPDKALDYINEALDVTFETDDLALRSMCYGFIGTIYTMAGQLDTALYYQRKGLEVAEETGNLAFELRLKVDVARSLSAMGQYKEAERMAMEVMDEGLAAGDLDAQIRAAEILLGSFRESGNFQGALEMHELMVLLNDSVQREENHRETIRQEYKYTYEKEALTDSLEFAKKEELKDLEIEKRDANLAKQRIGLAATGGGLLLLILLAVSIRKGKKRSDELLHNILPEEVATELKQKGKVGSKRIESVTVLFTDFKGFTSMAEKLTPRELVEDLNVCFSEFDRIMEKYGIEKIKTIGDAYMAAGGLPLPDKQHAQHVIQAAFEMRDFVEAGKAKKIEAGLPYFEIRIGVHTGPVVAGIVGVKKFQYDIWGDTVNTASRMESSGAVGQVNISEATYELVKDNSEFDFTSRGKIEAKGKGEMEMYFVNKK